MSIHKVEGEEGKPVVKTASGLQYVVLEEGSGPRPEKGDTIAAAYTLWLTDGTKIDSSHDRAGEFCFQVGTGRVIRGWDEALLDMTVGERRKLIVPPTLGYGARAVGAMPASSTLVFEVELLRIGDQGR